MIYNVRFPSFNRRQHAQGYPRRGGVWHGDGAGLYHLPSNYGLVTVLPTLNGSRNADQDACGSACLFIHTLFNPRTAKGHWPATAGATRRSLVPETRIHIGQKLFGLGGVGFQGEEGFSPTLRQNRCSNERFGKMDL